MTATTAITESYPPEMQAVLEDFALFDDWEERYAYLIDLGKRLPALPEAAKTPENKVHGCTSQVWFIVEPQDGHSGRLRFAADSDAYIVRGLIALLLRIFSGKTPAEITALDVQAFFAELGLKQHLSPNRSNGFFAMVQRIKQLARQYESAGVS